MQRWAGTLGDPQTDLQLAFGVDPPASCGHHAAVVEAALGVQEGAAVGVDEAVGDLAPLDGARDVSRQLAGVEHVAACVGDGDEADPLPRQRPGHRLVDQREPFSVGALADEDQPELGHRGQLEVDVADLPGHTECTPSQPLGRVEIGHLVGVDEPHEGVRRALRLTLQQPFGAPRPAVRHGGVGEVGLVRDRQREGALDGAERVARAAEHGVRPRGLFDAPPIVTEPPHRGRQAEAGLGAVALGERRLELTAGVVPPAGFQCRSTGGGEIVGSHLATTYA